MKKIILLGSFFVGMLSMQAQDKSIETLKQEQTSKEEAITALEDEIKDLQEQIDTFPGWKYGAFGTVGANLSGFDNWYSRDTPNNSSGNIGVTVNGYANLDREKFFWRNGANVNLGRVKNDNKDNDLDSDNFDSATDVFNITSLYGYKLNEKWAVSTLGEYRTTILENFNDPGYLDIGVGATWTPIKELIVVIHPLNYNFVFSKNDAVFESSLGAKIVADYTKELRNGINFKSNLSLFQSYKSSNYSNWTWVNSFGYTIWKGIGVGFEFGLRQNKQEELNYALKGLPQTTVNNIDIDKAYDSFDSDLQSYWLFGLSYSF